MLIDKFNNFKNRIKKVPVWVFILGLFLSGMVFIHFNISYPEVRGMKVDLFPKKEKSTQENISKEVAKSSEGSLEKEIEEKTKDKEVESQVATVSIQQDLNNDQNKNDNKKDKDDDDDDDKKEKKKKKKKKSDDSKKKKQDPEPQNNPKEYPKKCDKENPYLYVNGTIIEDACGNEFQFHGLSWFGFETPDAVLHGLWKRTIDDLLDVVEDNDFNALRVPLSIQNINDDPMPKTINYHANPDLKGKSSLEVMDVFVEKTCKRDVKIMFDIHRLKNTHISELWYEPGFSEEDVIKGIQKVVKRYEGSPCVVAFDLKNEPHGKVTYGTGDRLTDWKIGAEILANAVLEVNPNLLIFVEGVDHKYSKFGAFWGESFNHGHEFNIRKDKLVYSPHVYGPSVFMQKYFKASSFPGNMIQIWDYHFGFLKKNKIGPVVIGEFGGRYVGKDKVWQDKFVDYMIEREITSFFYWSLNPNSGDTGGILKNDWVTLEKDKIKLLQKLIKASEK